MNDPGAQSWAGFEDAQGAGFIPLPLPPLTEDPLASVLLANFNYAGFVEAAVDSVLRQTYEHVELIVCDDGSTDDSLAILRSLAETDESVILIEKENGGQASAMNLAYARSKGDIICWLDADDTLLPTLIERVVGLFSTEACGAVVGPMLVVDSSMSPLQRLPVGHRLESGWIAERVVTRGGRWGVVGGGGISVRRQAADAIFPIPLDQTVVADQFLYRLAPLLVPIGALDEPLYLYRTHGSNAGMVKELDPSFVRERLRSVLKTTAAVNERLQLLGLGARSLDTSRNVALKEQELYLRLFEATAPWSSLARDYRTVAKMLARDDLYGIARRCGLVASYGLALLLPHRLRSGFLSRIRSTSYGYGWRKALPLTSWVTRTGRRMGRRSGGTRGG